MLLLDPESCPARIVTSLLLFVTAWIFPACVFFSATSRSPVHCPPTVRTIVTADRNTIPIVYKEPVNQSNGLSLRALSHTTIYYDAGKGAIEYAKHSATSVRGGGEVEKDITIPVDAGKILEVHICVSATNSAGEGSLTH